MKVFAIYAIGVLLSMCFCCLASEGEWSAAIISGSAGQPGRWPGQAGPWGEDAPVSLQRHVPRWAEPGRDGRGACAIPQPGFREGLALLRRFPCCSPATATGASHKPRTLPCSAFATSNQPHTARALRDGCPGYREALRLTEATGAAAGPAVTDRSIDPSLPARPTPLPVSPGTTRPGPAPTPARLSLCRAGASRPPIGCSRWPIGSYPGLRPAPPVSRVRGGSLGPAPSAVWLAEPPVSHCARPSPPVPARSGRFQASGGAGAAGPTWRAKRSAGRSSSPRPSGRK